MDNDSFELILADTLALLRNTPPQEEPVKISPPPPPLPLPPPPPPKPLPKVEVKPIILETPSKVVPTSLSSIEGLLKKTAPGLPIRQEVPSDEKALRIKESYKSKQNIPDIPILYADPKDRPFLLNLARAIETCFAPSQPLEVTFFEKERTWDFFLKTSHLKLILIPDMVLWNSLDLMRYYKEIPSLGTRTLGDISLLLMANPQLYQTDSNLKRSLWHMIKNSLKSSSTAP